MTEHRFFVDEPELAGEILIAGAEFHHLANVLRLKTGDRAIVFNGRGDAYRAIVRELRKNCAALEICEKLPANISPLKTTLMQAVPKREKMSLIVEKATELGVSEIVPVVSEYGNRNIERIKKQITRWRRIAAESAKQCERADAPYIYEEADFEKVIPKFDAHLKIILHPRISKSAPAKTFCEVASSRTKTESLIIAVGPEGGFSEKEILLAVENGYEIMRLGPRILRTETSGLVALSIFQEKFGDLSAKEKD